MPSDDFWSASMLLHWVLMRDEHAVERMLGQYSDILVGMPVFEIQILDQDRNIIIRHDIDPTRANRPAKTWNDVIAEYELDPPVPPATENRELVNALIRSMELTKATQHIYSALQRGALEGHARRNGSGDVERIAPGEWTRLRFLGIDGHDLAVPTDVNGEPLGLLRPMADYLSGSVHPEERVACDPRRSRGARARSERSRPILDRSAGPTHQHAPDLIRVRAATLQQCVRTIVGFGGKSSAPVAQGHLPEGSARIVDDDQG
jgi:hypothetical protein